VAKAPNYIKAAFMMPANLVALGTAVITSAVTGEPLAALVALGAEGLYLGLLSTARPFQRAVRANALSAGEDPEADRDTLMEELSASQKEHYFALRGLRDRILENHRKLPGGRVLAASSEQRVDALLVSFLRLLVTLNHYRKFLNSADRKTVQKELSGLEAEITTDSNERLREVKQKRVEILRKRLERFTQAEESRELVSHQLAGIEDLLKLTHEQSISIRDPESLGRQLEALTLETQATEESVREMERFMEIEEISSGPQLPQGTRVR
jgi:hypothetical protein